MWNSILAGIVFDHHSIESLRRELSRNLSLAQTCGFNIFHGDTAIPSSCCYSRFMSKLAENHKELRKIFKVFLKFCYDNLDCRDRDRCPIAKQIRIPLKTDRRIFTPVARSSAKWEKLYNKRSAAERVNSRIDNMFGFEKHTIRGLKKMNTRVTLALILMLTFAVGKTVGKKPDEVRRFLSA